MHEKRRSKRQNIDLDVEITWDKNRVLGQLKDISEHGACCVMSKEIPLLKETKLRIIGDPSQQQFSLSAMTIRKEITSKRKEYLFGFHFKAKKDLNLLELLKAFA